LGRSDSGTGVERLICLPLAFLTRGLAILRAFALDGCVTSLLGDKAETGLKDTGLEGLNKVIIFKDVQLLRLIVRY